MLLEFAFMSQLYFVLLLITFLLRLIQLKRECIDGIFSKKWVLLPQEHL
jgi:predicted membrane protein